MIPEETQMPDVLKILNPELDKEIVVIGTKAYKVYPLNEGPLEIVSKEISEMIETMGTPDAICPKCLKTVKNAIGRNIADCPTCNISLKSLRKTFFDAILSSGKIPELVEQVVGLSKEEAKEITLKQIRHFAGVFWKQNLSDEGLPKESIENFRGLLAMMGIGEKEKKTETPAAETEKKD